MVTATNKLTSIFVTLGSWRAVALLALGIAEEPRLAPGALATDDVGFAGALATDLGAVVAETSGHVAVALQGPVVEVARHRDD